MFHGQIHLLFWITIKLNAFSRLLLSCLVGDGDTVSSSKETTADIEDDMKQEDQSENASQSVIMGKSSEGTLYILIFFSLFSGFLGRTTCTNTEQKIFKYSTKNDQKKQPMM